MSENLRDRYAEAIEKSDPRHVGTYDATCGACILKRGAATVAADAVLTVRDDALAEKDAENQRLRQCRAKHPTNPTVVPCVLNRDHEGDHASTTGCPGSVMHWPTAEAEVARLRETVGRVEALANRHSAARSGTGEPISVVLVGDLRAALAPRESATEAPSCACPHTPDNTWLSAASCGYGSGYEPGSMQEFNPDCPVHGHAATEAPRTRDGEPTEAEKVVARFDAMTQEQHHEGIAAARERANAVKVARKARAQAAARDGERATRAVSDAEQAEIAGRGTAVAARAGEQGGER